MGKCHSFPFLSSLEMSVLIPKPYDSRSVFLLFCLGIVINDLCKMSYAVRYNEILVQIDTITR